MAKGKLRVAIVRPSIVSGLAHGPAPGYCGNAAGFTSAAIAFASGTALSRAAKPQTCTHLPTACRHHAYLMVPHGTMAAHA